jgi:hypothetical protein
MELTSDLELDIIALLSPFDYEQILTEMYEKIKDPLQYQLFSTETQMMFLLHLVNNHIDLRRRFNLTGIDTEDEVVNNCLQPIRWATFVNETDVQDYINFKITSYDKVIHVVNNIIEDRKRFLIGV